MKRGAIKQDLRILNQFQGSTNCVIPENVENVERIGNTKNMERMENIKKS